MALAVTHAFVTAKTDGTDASLLRPSNWNASHVITVDTNTLIGKASAGTGPAEEIPVSAATIALLACADLPSILAYLGISPFTTGDLKPTLKTTADTGWIMGSINNTIALTSGATLVGVAYQALYTCLWNDIAQPTANAFCSVTGGLGATAAADWAANKAIQTPWFTGRTLAIAGVGGGLTTRTLGQFLGEETHALTSGENGPHSHANTLNDPTHTHAGSPVSQSNANLAAGGNPVPSTNNIGLTGYSATGMTITNASSGSGTGHNNMQPTTFVNLMIKL